MMKNICWNSSILFCLALVADLLWLSSGFSGSFWAPPSPALVSAPTRTGPTSTTWLTASSNENNNNNEPEEEEPPKNKEEMEKELDAKMADIEKMGDELMKLGNSVPQELERDAPKLGIDIGNQLKPLTDEEANDLKAAAYELINDGFAEGIDEIEKLRQQMKQSIDRQRDQMNFASDMQLQKEQTRLLNKIDQMTSDFLDKTREMRQDTKLAAQADQSMEGKGVEVGVWGTIGGAAVVTKGAKHVGLLGSVGRAKHLAEKEAKKQKDEEMADLKRSFSDGQEEEEAMEEAVQSNKLLIVADTSQDPLAKQIVPAFTEQLQKAIPVLEDIQILKPTDTMPLGGDNAACVILFCTSLSDRYALTKIMDRLLRRTMQPGGSIGSPPTQIVGITSLGTERTDKIPYSMQNLMGGKLDQRRQIEEAIIGLVQNRMTQPPLDYTICKFGEIKDSKEGFALQPGDVLDGTTPLTTATNILLQAVAYQPYARNATLCAVGNLPATATEEELDDIYDEAFLRLDGPELQRWTTGDLGHHELYDRLCEYLNEWANNYQLNPKGLTTPIRVEPSKIKAAKIREDGVRERSGVQLLFLPTKTGRNYLSREEEREREAQGKSTQATVPRNKMAKEGGIEVVVEITAQDNLRIRAKRCNYADGVPRKELSEETILGRLQRAIDVWIQETNV